MKGKTRMRRRRTIVLIGLALWTVAAEAHAAEGAAVGAERGLDTVWVLLAAFLVFFMQAGFGMVEAGFIRAKNACNILMKNFLDQSKLRRAHRRGDYPGSAYRKNRRRQDTHSRSPGVHQDQDW